MNTLLKVYLLNFILIHLLYYEMLNANEVLLSNTALS